jgi:hypothetical protein
VIPVGSTKRSRLFVRLGSLFLKFSACRSYALGVRLLVILLVILQTMVTWTIVT